MIMTDMEIKTMFSTEILKMEDKSAEMVIRTLLFEKDNGIDWKKAHDVALTFMPELRHYKPE